MPGTQEERLKELTDRLEKGLQELFESERYREYLQVMSRFHHYSANNSLLIAMQKPEATLVASYTAWQKKFQRQVMRGEKGIRIFAPTPVKVKKEQEKTDPVTGEILRNAEGIPETEEVTVTIPRFKVVTVFDVSQTDGKPLPELDVQELTADVDRFDMMMEAIRSVSPVPVRFDEIEGEARGYYSHVNKEIVIQKEMAESQTVKTALHELCHSLLHDRDFLSETGIEKDSQTKEVEAESCAFCCCAFFGLDTSDYSFPYLAGWSSGKDMKELKASLNTIRRTSSQIIDGIEESLREQLLANDRDRYELYQIGEQSPSREFQFMSLESLQSKGKTVNHQDYQLVYTGSLQEHETLDTIYEKFNVDHPPDFTGHSLSVSDVVVFHRNHEDHAYYVDRIGFTEIPEFLQEQAVSEQQKTEEKVVQEDTVPVSEEAKLTYYVAECIEFPVLGEYHEGLSLSEAVELYEKIPAERMNGVKGIGVTLDDGSDYAGNYELMAGGQMVTEGIEYVDYLKNHPFIQQAVSDLRVYFPEETSMEQTFVKSEEAKEKLADDIPKQTGNLQEPENRTVQEEKEKNVPKIPESREQMSNYHDGNREERITRRKESVLEALRKQKHRHLKTDQSTKTAVSRRRQKGEPEL